MDTAIAEEIILYDLDSWILAEKEINRTIPEIKAVLDGCKISYNAKDKKEVLIDLLPDSIKEELKDYPKAFYDGMNTKVSEILAKSQGHSDNDFDPDEFTGRDPDSMYVARKERAKEILQKADFSILQLPPAVVHKNLLLQAPFHTAAGGKGQAVLFVFPDKAATQIHRLKFDADWGEQYRLRAIQAAIVSGCYTVDVRSVFPGISVTSYLFPKEELEPQIKVAEANLKALGDHYAKHM